MDDKVKVAIRVRPFNRREKELDTRRVVEVSGSKITLNKSSGSKRQHVFLFDSCFDSTDPQTDGYASQAVVFESIGSTILESYNACIFAYGQTGSGKSYTMMGTKNEPGIIPRLCSQLFKLIPSSEDGQKANVEVSYMEIYNEKVFDLLDLGNATKKSGLKVREHKVLGPYVEGCRVEAVADAMEIENLMEEGNKSRTVAATNMNSESSRSHAVFTIVLTFSIRDSETGVSGSKVSRISLVDLAGSERANKTGAQGDRLKEGSNINKSLTTLGLVISKLAENSSGKSKDNFVPYRDSTLTWLLKENLGGNSKTVMVATVSPADDNIEETLSTLRYADRAKRITNRAVVNEDQNAKIIRELRAEVELLRKMLSTQSEGESGNLLEKIMENENFMKSMSLTWEEKLARSGQNIQDRRQALERMGLHLESRGVTKTEDSFYIARLSSDPSMNEVLVYYLRGDVTRVGSSASGQDITLAGLGIKAEHCQVVRRDHQLLVSPLPGAITCVNGAPCHQTTQLAHGDRILWGSNNFFRVYCPSTENERLQPLPPFDFDHARSEVRMDQDNDILFDNLFNDLSNKFKEGKQQQGGGSVDQTEDNIMKWLDYDSNVRDSQFRKSLEKLKSGWLQASSMARDANVVAMELERPIKYSITLQIPAENLSPNNNSGVFVENPSILVKSIKDGSQIWSMEKLDSRLKDMIDIYDKITTENIPYAEIGKSLPDPFFDTVESHSLIGVASLFLQPLFHDLKFEYHTPIISQDGRVSGKLLMTIQRISGNMEAGEDEENTEDGSDEVYESSDEGTDGSDENQQLKFRLSVVSVSGLPPSLAHFVFCQLTFNGDTIVVPPLPRQSSSSKKTAAVEFMFNFAKEFTMNVTDSFRHLCKTGAISVQVFGQKSKGFFSIREALRDRRRAQTVAERYSVAHPDLCWVCFNLNLKCEHRGTRWSELVRNIQLWIEIQEMNEHGTYTAVEVAARDDGEDAGGVVQLRHGHQRRLVARLSAVPNSGNLPLNIHSVVSVSAGSLVARSKFQRPLNSFQDEGLSRVRDSWAMRVHSIKDRLDTIIHKLADKDYKTKEDQDLEKSLIEKKNCIIDELNKVLVTGEENGTQSHHTASGMEMKAPLIFMDSPDMDSMENITELDDFLPIIGEDSFLPKEQSEDFIPLPIINELENEIGVVAAWDSSAHEDPKLNRVTPDHEKLYMIVRVVARLTDPAAVDLVLRKRICINIFKRPSITSFFKKNLGNYLGRSLLTGTGVTFELVKQVPDIYTESEWFAQIEANIDEESETLKETFMDSYSKAVTAVENLIFTEKGRQKEILTEMILRQEELQKEKIMFSSLRKSSSVMHMRQTKSSFGLNNLGSTKTLSTSQHSLDVSALRSSSRLSGSSTELAAAAANQKRRTLPPRKPPRVFSDAKHRNLSGGTITEED